MNKKKVLSMILAGLMLIGFASAVLVDYFGQRTTTIDVNLPIEITGEELNEFDGIGCEEVEGNALLISNIASIPIDVEISATEEEGVETTFVGNLGLTQKIVDFELDVWETLPDGNTAIVEYTVVGDSFNAEVIDGTIEGYTLIYYKDNSDRFNSPAEGILVADVVGNLPYVNDRNIDEYDYCLSGEYNTCHGAKLWYVPITAITTGVLDWNRADEFLFETMLIQYNDAGIITMYPGADLEITPVFELDCLLEGQISITTVVDLFEEV